MAGRRGPGGPMGGQYLTEEEKQAQPRVTKELLLRVLSYITPYWKQMAVVLASIKTLHIAMLHIEPLHKRI